MKEPKLTPSQLEWRARVYALLITDALYFAVLAYERGDQAEGRRIERAIHFLVKLFSRPDGVEGFASALSKVMRTIIEGDISIYERAVREAHASGGRLH
jgi:hypothetical protein